MSRSLGTIESVHARLGLLACIFLCMHVCVSVEIVGGMHVLTWMPKDSYDVVVLLSLSHQMLLE